MNTELFQSRSEAPDTLGLSIEDPIDLTIVIPCLNEAENIVGTHVPSCMANVARLLGGFGNSHGHRYYRHGNYRLCISLRREPTDHRDSRRFW